MNLGPLQEQPEFSTTEPSHQCKNSMNVNFQNSDNSQLSIYQENTKKSKT